MIIQFREPDHTIDCGKYEFWLPNSGVYWVSESRPWYAQIIGDYLFVKGQEKIRI